MFRDKLKSYFKKVNEEQEGNDKRKIENIIFFIILLIATIVIINTIWNGNKQTTKQENNINTKQLAYKEQNNENIKTTVSEELEKKLENILSKIEGVGNVKVCINYSESSEVVAMYNENSKVSTTEETDTSGGLRKIQQTDSQKDIVYKEDNGEKTPITKKVVQPKIEGAIITAKGASNANIKANIIQAVEAVTGVASHKIQVFEMN
ncbi:MAG: hypothetical protein U0L98_03400 [Clostridia bacterium]|nr:hypothetical protein [Clostridia bacterium]